MAQRVDTGFDAMELRTMDSVDSIDTLNPELTQRLRVRAFAPCGAHRKCLWAVAYLW